MNPIGLVRNYDVIPNFSKWMAIYDSHSGLRATFTSIGNTLVLQSNMADQFRTMFISQRDATIIRYDEAQKDIKISKQNEVDIADDMKEVEKMMADIQKRIEKAKDDMEKKPLKFGKIAGNVFQVAVAVGAIMTAVPTGGASLLAVAPDYIAFGKTVYDNAAPLVQAMIDDKETETLTTAKERLAKVKKDGIEISNTYTKVTDLINLINTIKSQKTPDNSKLMDLVQKGAEFAYAYLSKKHELTRAQMKTKALDQKADAEKVLREFQEDQIKLDKLNQEIISQAGLKIIQAAFAQVDIFARLGFPCST